ncbi:MAG: M48 family metallopeptidase [bacterium]
MNIFRNKKTKEAVIKSEIKINNLDVTVLKKDIKNLHLNVLPPDGKVRVSAPKRFSDDSIRLFVISKLPWIKKHVEHFQLQPRETPREYITGESHYFKGARYLLNVIEYDGRLKIEISNMKYIYFYVKKNMSREQKEEIFLRWYRKELEKELFGIFIKWQNIMGVGISEWRIKRMKTKWGTCNTKAKRIWINLELIKKPLYCVEYIVVHELAHLLERNHNKKFYGYIDKFMPQWKSYKKELNEPALRHYADI